MSSSVPDLRIEARCRNNVLWHAIFDVYPSVAAFCRAHDLGVSVVGEYLNLTRTPYREPELGKGLSDVLRPTARQLCEVTGLGPDALFPALLYSGVIPPRRVAEIHAAQVGHSLTGGVRVLLPASQEDDVQEGERRAIVAAVLDTLTPRQRDVVARRFGFDGHDPQTLEEVGRFLGLTRETIRTIEAKALRRLRKPSPVRRLRPFLDTTAVPDEADRTADDPLT